MATIKVCDICNSQKDINLREYEIGTQPDAAGGPSESIVKSYDLCQSCEVIILNNTIKSIIKESKLLPTITDIFDINKKIITKITDLINLKSDLILNNKKFLN